MTAAPSYTAVSLSADAHAHLQRNALVIESQGGKVTFQPPASMPAADLAAIASQIISVCEQWRDDALKRDAANVPVQRAGGGA